MSGDFQIDVFRREDAEGISRLFRSVYGEGYPIRIFYDPAALTEANETGRYYSIVARTNAGEIIGVQHLFRSAPYERLYELGAGLVRADYRQLGINKLMLRFVWEEWVPQRTEIEETFGEAVCNHLVMQRAVTEFKHIETALEVALMPAEAYDVEQSATGRVAAIMAFRCYKPKLHPIFLPPTYERRLRSIYWWLNDARDLTLSDAAIPAGSVTHAEMSIFDFAQVARIAVHAVGVDFEDRLVDLENSAVAGHCVVLQVWVKLTTPWVGAAVHVLRRNGFVFGGLLPRWFDDDGLLMQKIMCDPNWGEIKIHSDHGRELLAMVRKDFERGRL